MKTDAAKRYEALKKIIMMMFGILAPMPILNLFGVTAYVWGLLIWTLYVGVYWIREKIYFSEKIEKSYVLLFLLTLVSYFLCFIRMPEEWTYDLTSLLMQLIMVFIFYVFFISQKEVSLLIYFVKGVYYSSLIQMVWSYLQFVLYKIGIDLNNIVFRDLLHLIEGSATHIQLGDIKLSGFCWNGANLAPLVIFGYIYSDSIIIKLLFILLTVIAGSRTLMISMMFCIGINVIYEVLIYKKIKQKTFIILLALALSVIIIGVIKWNAIYPKILKMMQLLNVVQNFSTEGSTNTHIFYLISVGTATKMNDFLSNLFGYGPRCSGYVFSKFFGYYTEIGKWVVECDYIDRLWSYGYLGFLVYYFWYFKNIWSCSKKNFKYTLLFLTLLLAEFMYNITFNWLALLILVIFLLNKNGITIFK